MQAELRPFSNNYKTLLIPSTFSLAFSPNHLRWVSTMGESTPHLALGSATLKVQAYT